MKQKTISLLIITILITTTILFLVYSKEVMETVTFSISIWKDNLLPSLFPFFIVSELLINYGLVELLSEALKNFMNKVFHLPGEAAFVIIGSLISGFPSSSKYINELLITKKISVKNAEYLLKFNHFSNPLFVIGTIGTLLLNNKKLGLLILLVHIISNFLIAIIFRPKNCDYSSNSSFINGLDKMNKKRIEHNSSFVSVLTESIFKTFKTLILLLGVITFFLIISTLIKQVIPTNDLTYSIISGLLEMTGGIKNISSLNFPIQFKASIITFFISFGGFSIHMQVMSILSNYKIKYIPYFISRLLHGIIASTIVYIILTVTQFL